MQQLSVSESSCHLGLSCALDWAFVAHKPLLCMHRALLLHVCVQSSICVCMCVQSSICVCMCVCWQSSIYGARRGFLGGFHYACLCARVGSLWPCPPLTHSYNRSCSDTLIMVAHLAACDVDC